MEYSEIAPFFLVGTNLCCENHAQRLYDLGASIDISLEEENTAVPEHFTSFVWLPVPDHEAPSIEQLDIGTAVIEQAEQKGYRVYAHCKNGHGRSPTLAVAYYIRKGMSAAEAEAYIRERRPEIDLTDAQRARLEEYAQQQG